MIALDTNVLVRFLVRDDEAQTAAAVRLLDLAGRERAKLFVPIAVLCETIWVLARFYKFDRREIASVVSSLLAAQQLTIEHADDARRSLDAYSTGNCDFADYLHRERALTNGAARLATFDTKLLSESSCIHPDPANWDEGISLHERPPSYGQRSRRAPTRP